MEENYQSSDSIESSGTQTAAAKLGRFKGGCCFMFRINMKLIVGLMTCTLWIGLPTAGECEGEFIISVPEIGELFAVQHRYYRDQPIGSASVQNNTDMDLLVESSITVAEYAPESVNVITPLPAGETIKAPLRIGFTPGKLTSVLETLTLDARVEIHVRSDSEQLYLKQFPTAIQLNDLHIVPDKPPEALAYFIDPNEPSVAKFAQEARREQTHSNLQTAQILFGLMRKANIICVEQSSRRVWYPVELLRRKIGGNLDCVLLYAAFLEKQDQAIGKQRSAG